MKRQLLKVGSGYETTRTDPKEGSGHHLHAVYDHLYIQTCKNLSKVR